MGTCLSIISDILSYKESNISEGSRLGVKTVCQFIDCMSLIRAVCVSTTFMVLCDSNLYVIV